VAAFAPLRGSLAPRRRVIGAAYAVALAEVAAGVVLATAMLAGYSPVVERWALLKPAHAWLNVFGFLSVVIATSLIHLAPTVAGGRIRERASAIVAISALLVGAPLVALGFALGSDPVARLGALVELAGALSLAAHGLAVQHDRAQWTIGPDWHRMAGWSLASGPVWFLVAATMAAGRVLALGASPAAWSLELLAAPLVLGWLVQVLIGSWTHLVPAIGPGDQARHAAQRAILGRLATARVVLLNGGVALLVAGGVSGVPTLFVAGAAGCLTAVAVALAVLVEAAILTGRGPQAIAIAPSGGG
jgi:nitrite reductase (NO-forming)